jgi:hypothetical protein
MGLGYSYHNAVWVGHVPYTAFGYSAQTFALDGADDRFAFSFLAPPGGPTLTKVLVYASAVAGAPLTDAKLQCDIYSDASGSPNASVASRTTVTAKPGAAAWVEFTGFALTLTGGNIYWIVLSNIEADPTTKYPTYKVTHSAWDYYSTVGHASVKASVDAGSTWTGITQRMGVIGFRLEFSDGYCGFPTSAYATSVAANAVYSNREDGAYFTTPAVGNLVVAGAIALTRVAGSPGNGVQFRLYKGTTLVDTTKAVLVANIQTTTGAMAFFTASRVLDPNTVYRLTLSHSGAAGDSSNYYALGYHTLHDDANSRALTALRGWQRTYTTDATGTPPSFSETATDVPAIALILDADAGPITADCPAAGNVTEDDTTNGVTGTYHEAAEAEVENGVQFGADGTEYTGTLSAASGGGVPVFGGMVSRRV